MIPEHYGNVSLYTAVQGMLDNENRFANNAGTYSLCMLDGGKRDDRSRQVTVPVHEVGCQAGCPDS